MKRASGNDAIHVPCPGNSQAPREAYSRGIEDHGFREMPLGYLTIRGREEAAIAGLKVIGCLIVR